MASLPEIRVEMTYGDDGLQHMLLNGADVTKEIRLPEISMYASAVSAHPGVRAFLLDTQRDMAKTQSVIMDGRDIGTVVLPDAEIKIFIVADAEERAKRRYKELIERGQNVPFEEVLQDIVTRDYNDENRAEAPLRQAEDATLVDSSYLTIEESAATILSLIDKKM